MVFDVRLPTCRFREIYQTRVFGLRNDVYKGV